MWLVTGARGFVGRRLVRVLAAAGVPHRALVGDAAAPGQIRAAAEGATGIVHLAAKHVDHDGTGFAANVAAAAAVAEILRERSLRGVALSSVGVYGHRPHRRADEATPVAPDTPLSRARVRADRHLAAAGATLLRPRFVYGPGDVAVIPRLVRGLRRMPVWLDGGRAELSLVHVDDLVSVIRAAMTDPAPPDVVHVTDGRPIALRDVAGRVWARLDRPGRLPRGSVPAAPVIRALQLWERLRGIDPEASPSALSSIRLRLAATDDSFSSDRLRAWRPDLTFRTLDEGLTQAWPWYAAQLAKEGG